MQKWVELPMPKILKILGYVVYFWCNENDEPIHVHVSKGKAQSNGTKLWILRNGDTELVHNKSKVSEKDLKRIRIAIKDNKDEIVSKWLNHFGSISYKGN